MFTYQCPKGHQEVFSEEIPSGVTWVTYCHKCQQSYPSNTWNAVPNYQPAIPRDPLLAEREKTHGSFAANANAWMDIRETFRKHTNGRDNNRQALALEMIALKLARLLQNPKEKDHWDDIAGYAKLGSEACDE